MVLIYYLIPSVKHLLSAKFMTGTEPCGRDTNMTANKPLPLVFTAYTYNNILCVWAQIVVET